jgi:hypothetical protein
MNLALIACSTKSFGELSKGNVEGRELVTRVCFCTDDLTVAVNRKFNLIFWTASFRVVVPSDLDGQIVNTVGQLLYFVSTFGDVFSKAV